MKISELKLSKSAIDFLKNEGYSELYPPQQDSINAGLLDGENILVSAPTASGKTLIAILRHGPEWIEDIGLVIADEIHLIGDEDRGQTLEVVLTKLKLLESKPQILALSATITNVDELSEWLDCKTVESQWRPVPLYEGVYDGDSVIMNDGREFPS